MNLIASTAAGIVCLEKAIVQQYATLFEYWIDFHWSCIDRWLEKAVAQQYEARPQPRIIMVDAMNFKKDDKDE